MLLWGSQELHPLWCLEHRLHGQLWEFLTKQTYLSQDLAGLFNPASYFEKLNEIGAGEMSQQLKALTILYLIRPEFGFPAPTLKAKDYL